MSPESDENALRAKLEAEHQERQERFRQTRERSRSKSEARREKKRAQVEAKAEMHARKAFYKEKGYKRYVDSRGKEHWLLPEEYEWRVKSRAQREERNKKYASFSNGRTQTGNLKILVAACLGAVLLGLILLASS